MDTLFESNSTKARFKVAFAAYCYPLMKCWKTILLSACVAAIAGALGACGNNNNSWYTATGDVCGQGMPRPGCDFYSNGSRIVMYADPYYTQAAVAGLTTWQSPDGITYNISCACALS